MHPIPKDLREFIGLFHSQGVEFVMVGGFALAFHGAPRFTEDIDFLVRSTPENAERIEAAINAFGFGGLGITKDDFLVPEQVIQLGRPPNRIDILTSISGVSWEEAWASRTAADLGGLEVWCIGKERLIENKRATGRVQDLADVERLQKGRA